MLVDPASVHNLERNAVRCSSHHLAWTTPLVIHRYFAHSRSLLHLMMLVLDILDGIVVVIMPLDRLGISTSGRRTLNIVGFAILSGLTLIVTGLVVVRLLLVRRRHVKAMGKCNVYHRVHHNKR